MAANGLQNWAFAWILLQVFLTVVQAQKSISPININSSLNTTSRLEDYIIQNQRQYANNILEYERQISEIRNNYLDQLSTTDVLSAQVEELLRLTDERLNPLELLDELSKHCVQKYRGSLITWASTKISINTCVSSASSYVNSLVSALESTMRTLTNYYNVNVKNALTDCTKKNPTSRLNYTICVTQVINTANTYTANNRDTFIVQLKSTKCTGDGRLQTAIRCTFTVLNNVISAVARVTSSIENCITGVGECQPCSPTEDPTCSRVVYMDPYEVDPKNATIPNPLYGANIQNLTCLHIDFQNLPQ